MIAQNKLSPKDLFIIHEQKFSHFPLKVSTNLYPEWSVVASRELDIDTVSKIAVALYGYKNLKGGNNSLYGFTIPGDYGEIDTLARMLRIPPYNYTPSSSHEDIWNKHSMDIILLVSVTVLFFIVLGEFYRRIRFKKQYIQSILNAAPTPIIVTNGVSLISANTAFLNFVKFETFEAFKSKYNCICDLFEVNISVVQNKGLFRTITIFDDISELLNKSSTDALTHVANRTQFNLLFEHSLYIAQREKTPLSLIFFDIDHFKAVNDTYGHLVGDDVLYHLANLAKNSLRKSDIVARWGGEEFIVILPNTSLKPASQLAEELREAIESDEFAVVQHITCSFGVSQFQESEEGEKLLLRLDELLYSAKENGRNRVEVGCKSTLSLGNHAY